LNAINDIFPALALGFGPGDERVMQRPPRDPDEPIMTRNNWLELAVYAAVLAAFVLAGFVFVRSVLGLPEREAVTVSFFSLAFGRLWHIWNMRDAGSPVFNNTIFRNGYVWGAILLCSVLILLAVTVSPISVVLDVRFPPAAGWLVILAASLVPTLLIQAVRWALRR
jgi:Ca2+-transporting ATPase